MLSTKVFKNASHWLSTLALLFCHGAVAQIQLSKDITMSGFGTISAAKSNNPTPVLINRHISDDWCFDCDTTLGIQFDWLISDAVRSTLQVVKRPQDTFSDPEIERAFIEYSLNNTQIKIGRLRTPLFIMSEYYYVSNAYPWLRLPSNVYSNNLGITHYDGITADISVLVGEESQLSLSPFISFPSKENYQLYGQTFSLDVSRAIGISSELSYGDNLLRLAYVDAKVEQQFDNSPPTDYAISMFSIGFSHYFGQLHFQTETLLTEDLNANWYANLDYHLGKITPYVQYGQSRRGIESNNYLIGFRYDWTDRVNTSVEWQHISGEEKIISGHFTELQDPSKPFTSEVDLFSIGLSFTF